MLWRAVAVAFVAAGGLAMPAAAQAALGGPAEPPPPGFTGVQYVDSRGCAFVRAGLGGQVTWVRRIGSDRRPLCGLQPTRVAMAQAQARLAAEAAAPQPAAVPAAPASAAAPARTPPPAVTATTAAAATPAPAAPRREAPVIRASGAVTILPAGGTCPEATPNLQRFELVGGGLIDLCLARGVVITGARPVGVATAAPPAAPPVATAGRVAVAGRDPRIPEVVVPPGYRLAWEDDRLNPNRGRGTAEGDRQMAAIWAPTVPKTLLDAPREPAAAAPAVRVSTRAAPATVAAPAAAAGMRVQVGSFAVPANARAAEARLAALGLPVETGRAMLRGRAVEVVRAGPFASAAEAQAALAMVRRAGFRDAILRR
jgi:cell division septation protein DedD